MNKTELTTRIWYKVPIETLLHELNIPNMTPEYLPEVCKLNPQKITGTMLSLVERSIRDEDIKVIPIHAAFPTKKDDEYIECVVILGGDPREIEKLLDLDLGCERLGGTRELDHEQTHKMRENAFYFMRKGNIRDFSSEELHRVFKHCKEKLFYTAIVKDAVDNGLTIQALYEQDHDHGISR